MTCQLDLPTGLAFIEASGEDPRLVGFIEQTAGELEQNDQFFVMFRKQTFAQERKKELVSMPSRGVLPYHSVGMVGSMTSHPDIRMVLMWSDRRDPVNSGAKTWLDFYDKWYWNQAVEHGEIALGNVQRSVADFVREIPITLAYILKLRDGYWASYMKPKIDPNSPPIMGMRPGYYQTPSVGLYETGVGKVVGTNGRLSLVSNDPAFATKLDSIKQDLEKCAIM